MSDPSAGGYSLSDLGKKNGGGLPSSGGYSLSSLGGGGNLSSNGPIPTFNPTAGAPANAGSAPKGGGGILGWLGRAGSGALHAVEGVPSGVGQLLHDTGNMLGRGSNNLVNDVAYGATLGHLGGYNEKHLGDLNETPNYSHPGSALGALVDTSPGSLARAIREYPSIEGARAGLVRSGMEVAHPTQLVHNYSTDPVGSLLNDAANVALVGGPAAAGVLKGAGIAADSAGLTRAGEIADAASRGAGHVAASPLLPFTKSAGLIGDLAAKTAAGQAVAEKAGQAADAVRNTSTMQRILARQAVDPIAGQRTYDQGRLGQDVVRSYEAAKQVVPDPTEQAASILLAQHVFGGLDENGTPLAAHLDQALSAHPQAGAIFDHEWNAQGEGLPAEFRPSAEAARLAVKAEIGDLPADQLARLHAGAEAVRGVDEARTARESSGYGRLGGPLSPENMIPEPRMGTVAEMTAKEKATAEKMSARADTARATAARLADQAGRVETINEGNSGLHGVEAKSVEAANAADRAQRASQAGQEAVRKVMGSGVAPEDINPQPSALDQILGREAPQAPATPMENLSAARAKIEAAKASGDISGLNRNELDIMRSDIANARAEGKYNELDRAKDDAFIRIAERGRQAGMTEGVRTGKAQYADRLATIAERQAQRAAERYDVAVKNATESAQAAAAKYRPALTHAADFLGALRDEAVKAGEAGDGASAEALAGLAKDLEPLTKLSRFQGSVEQPAHTIGASDSAVNRAADGRPARPTSSDAATMRKSGSERQRVGNTTAYTFEGQKQLELSRVAEQTRNEYAKGVEKQLSTTADKVLGADHGLSPTETYAAMTQRGFVPWDPKGLMGDRVAPTKITADTRWLTEPVYNEVKRYADGIPAPGKFGRSLDAVTRWVYKNPLQVSPSYLIKRTVGNAFVAAVEGMSPVDIIRYGTRAAQMIREGDAPVGLKGTILDDSATQGQGRLSRGISAPARTIDQMTGVMLYLFHMDQGAEAAARLAEGANPADVGRLTEMAKRADPAEAMRLSNKALGSYQSLGPYERDVVRRVFPVYPWMKQVSQVAAKLGAEHPASVVWALHLGDIAQKEKFGKPSATVEQFDPATLFTIQPGDLVNPVVRGGFGAATGFNLASLKDVTRPPTEAQHGPITNPAELAYFLAAQTPPGKLLEQSPLPGVGRSPDYARYNTGELKLSRGHTLPAFVPPTKTPVGDFGPYFRQFLGVPAEPAVNAAGQAAHQKLVAKQAKTANAYKNQVARLRAQGVR